ASDVSGTWYGRFDFHNAKPPKTASPQQVQAMEKMMAKVQLTLVMKKDGSYSIAASGFGPKAQTSTGKWTLKGAALSLNEGKGVPQAATVSKDGKSITMAPPGAPGVFV